jgi:hypothetical protein
MRCFVIKDSREDNLIPFVRKKSISVSDRLPYWRLMRVDRVQNIVVIKRKRRHYRKDYTGGTDKNIKNIIISLDSNRLRKTI